MKFSPDQEQALEDLYRFTRGADTAHALAGPAGTGKTTILRQLKSLTSRPIVLTATTNKAARVVAAMADCKPLTIHSLLKLRPQDDPRRGRTILRRIKEAEVKIKPESIVVVDEASMVDADLLAVILKEADEREFKVLFVGDPYQLPPVYSATCPAFADVPTSYLTTVHRQALDNPVLRTANDFRLAVDGHPFPQVAPAGNTVIHLPDDEFVGLMLETFEVCGDHKVLAYRNDRVRDLGGMLRRHLMGPDADRYRFIPGESFIVNSAVAFDDEVVIPTEGEVRIVSTWRRSILLPEGQLRGEAVTVDYEGELFELFVPLVWKEAKDAMSCLFSQANAIQREANKYRNEDVPFDLERARRAAWSEFYSLKRRIQDLRTKYASTVHKSQGSTYDWVFVDVGDIGSCTRADLIARMMYVAISRASDSAVMTGDLPQRVYKEAA